MGVASASATTPAATAVVVVFRGLGVARGRAGEISDSAMAIVATADGSNDDETCLRLLPRGVASTPTCAPILVGSLTERATITSCPCPCTSSSASSSRTDADTDAAGCLDTERLRVPAFFLLLFLGVTAANEEEEDGVTMAAATGGTCIETDRWWIIADPGRREDEGPPTPTLPRWNCSCCDCCCCCP